MAVTNVKARTVFSFKKPKNTISDDQAHCHGFTTHQFDQVNSRRVNEFLQNIFRTPFQHLVSEYTNHKNKLCKEIFTSHSML